jgi:hypothetical protein
LYSLHDSKSRQIPGLAAAMFAQPNNNGFMDHSLPAFVGDINFNGALYLINGNLRPWITFHKSMLRHV